MKIVRKILWGWTIFTLVIGFWPAAFTSLAVAIFVTATAGDAAYVKGDESVESYLEYLKWRFYSKRKS